MALTTRLFANNVRTTLAGAINSTDLTITFATGAGATMPAPNSANGEYFELTLQDSATGLRTEIIAISTMTGDVGTIHSGGRGQQGTSAQSWAAGDIAFLAVTKGSLDGLTQPYQIQSNALLFASASGTADALTATLSPAVSVLADGMKVYIKAASANATTTPTLALNGLTARTIVKGSGSALAAGDIIGAGHVLELVYKLSSTQWILQNPALPTVSGYDATLKTIAASVGSNALTISTPTAQTVNFRSATLSDGTINSRSVAAQSLVVPSGATLGTIAAQQSRIAVLAIDNAGTPELAVTNIAAGANLDETTLISTKAIATTATGTGVIAVTTGILTISGSPTGTWEVGMAVKGTGVPAGTYITALGTGTGGAGTYYTNITTAVSSTAMTGVAGMGIYSTTARSSLPFRVLGYVESTQATAGTWATTPSTVQGQSGQSIWAAPPKITNALAVATNGGTSYDFTGIPAGVKRITVMFNGVSTNGTSLVQVQLGSGSVETSGYLSSAGIISNSTVGPTRKSTTGLIADGYVAIANARNSLIIISTLGSNQWVMSGNSGNCAEPTTNEISVSAGSVTLSGTLNRLRITTVNGTDLFDAGSANISWEF